MQQTEARGHLSSRTWLVAGGVFALAATGLLVLADDARWLRLGIVAALWAALLGAFLATHYRRKADLAEESMYDAQETYEIELEREVAARREYELQVESEARRRANDDTGREIDSLRGEVTHLRETLEKLFGGEVLYERVALTAHSTRMRGLAEGKPRTARPGESTGKEMPKVITSNPAGDSGQGTETIARVLDPVPEQQPGPPKRAARPESPPPAKAPPAAKAPRKAAPKSPPTQQTPPVQQTPAAHPSPPTQQTPPVQQSPPTQQTPPAAPPGRPPAQQAPPQQTPPAQPAPRAGGRRRKPEQDSGGYRRYQQQPEPEQPYQPYQPTQEPAAEKPYQPYRPYQPYQPQEEPRPPAEPEPEGSHSTGLSVADLLAAHGSGEQAPRRRRRLED